MGRLFLAACIVLAASVAGCGDDDDSARAGDDADGRQDRGSEADDAPAFLASGPFVCPADAASLSDALGIDLVASFEGETEAGSACHFGTDEGVGTGYAVGFSRARRTLVDARAEAAALHGDTIEERPDLGSGAFETLATTSRVETLSAFMATEDDGTATVFVSAFGPDADGRARARARLDTVLELIGFEPGS